VLKDLSSTNGTRVNGWRVRGQVTVRAGDVIRFGDVEYALTQDQGLPQSRGGAWLGGAEDTGDRAGKQSH
jgi:pSer/pThr/pTyr-binding forkhead associated (FHA) protein